MDDINDSETADGSLRRSEQAYRNLVEVLPAAVYICDGESRVTFYNQAAAALWGREPEIGKDLWCGSWRIYRPDGTPVPLEECPMAVAMREARPICGEEIVVERPDGVRRNVLVYPEPICDASGAVIGATNMLVDITERRQAEDALRESEERFRTLADNMSQLAWMVDARGLAFWYNQRWLDYTGTTLEEMQGWGWRQVHHPDHVDRVVARIQHSWDTGEEWEDTFPLRAKDGSYRWFLSRAVPIRDAEGRVIRWFGTNTDVTEQRAGEQRLKEANRHKDEFLAMLAHELRNPLAPICNALQIVRRKHDDADAVQAASEVMERQLGQLVRLVDDLLDVNRIGHGKIELRRERIELASVVHHAVEAVRPQCEAMNHELSISVPAQAIHVHADPTRLTQVIGNLLNNACKFTGEGGRIELSVEREDGQAVIRVRDNGIGLAAGDLDRVFGLFTQVDTSKERSVSGLGIGLALAKNLVELHGGTMEVRSAGLGGGSEFLVRLPILAAVSADGSAEVVVAASEPASARTQRFLVVDDNRDSADSRALLLNFAGHQTQVAYDGEAAIEAAASFRPDVVLLDIGLPKLNGLEVARHLRQQPWGTSIILVALSGWGRDQDRRESIEAGFDGHLVKPVNEAQLAKLLGEIAKTRNSATG